MRKSTVFLAVLLGLLSVAAVLAVAADEKRCGFSTQRVQCGDLACDAEKEVCIRCRTDADCYPDAMRCNANSGKCVSRSFTALFGFRLVVAMIGAFAICSIAVVAGVGGGGMLVPMFSGLIRIPMESSVGLSQSTICGQSTLNMYLAVQKKFPVEAWERPLINYQYLSLMLPLGLIGTLLGGILSKVCPDVLRLVLLFVLLSFVLVKTVNQMKKQYARDKETASATDITVTSADAPQASPNKDTPTDSYGTRAEGSKEPGSPSSAPSASAGGNNASPTTAAAAAANDKYAQKDPQPQYPKFEIGMNFLSFFVLLIFNILRNYASCGGIWYWCCVVIPLAALGYAFYHTRQRLERISVESPSQLTFDWNHRNNFTFPMVALIAGAAAAMLGIGGGLVLGFVLYEIGFIPEEASVTGGMATFFIAFSSALQLLVTGRLLVDFGFVFFLVGMGSTFLGQFVFMKEIKARGWRFLIVGCLVFVVGGSLVVLGGYGIYNAVVSSRLGGSVMAFGALCPSNS